VDTFGFRKTNTSPLLYLEKENKKKKELHQLHQQLQQQQQQQQLQQNNKLDSR